MISCRRGGTGGCTVFSTLLGKQQYLLRTVRLSGINFQRVKFRGGVPTHKQWWWWRGKERSREWAQWAFVGRKSSVESQKDWPVMHFGLLLVHVQVLNSYLTIFNHDKWTVLKCGYFLWSGLFFFRNRVTKYFRTRFSCLSFLCVFVVMWFDMV